MRPLILLFLCAFLFLSCKKNEESTSTPLLPQATCDDTTDDGRFEAWDSTERKLLLNYPSCGIPDTMVPGYIKQIDMVSRTITLTNPEFSFRAIYDTGTKWEFDFVLVDHTTGNREGYGYIKRSNIVDKDTVMERVALSAGTGLTQGCKRLYYHAYKVTLHNPHTSTLTLDYHVDILFKGHYDVSVN